MNEGVSSPQGHSGLVDSEAVKQVLQCCRRGKRALRAPVRMGGSHVLREGGRWAEKGEGPCQEAASPGQGDSAVQVGVKAFLAAVDKTACAAWPEVGRKQETSRGEAGCQVKELEI